ncbi:hypothetical protein P175DRAFT_0500168 [Aspergillus ochraceoroseus IBT 24754]|uniref:Yeast cell wall synthesis Kre9/Knh1-like N-terminal domain-containing protein n=2 Tax=Aspergillus ochraceoroseus TaxID=138278 RepID=A0A2T5M4Z3_9EURO|nr:uncharacterized protein P175DRAFT_0500168 [Aspergillus ochraceoroseus IBT 24754]KKK22265.1 extracellular proline-serine rich protein [Aspergillus ochraceoroseus]PTU23607.1 hypothetical protein P175DRAFT_0500168 [Aspergillus ochraceoroseus IBT 24754]
MRAFIPLAILLNSLAAAISITEPGLNATYAAGSTVTVNWTTVDTDPSYFSLYLWNFVSWPPSYLALATNIPTSDGSYSVQIPCDTNPEWGYQISAINGTNIYIIYAQGAHFTVNKSLDGSRCVDTVSSPSVSTCRASTAVSTVYVTVSPTDSSSSHPPLAPSSAYLHPTPALPPPSPTTATSSKYTKPGIVPKTIGWSSDYSHPVTLDKVPTPTAPGPTATLEAVSRTKRVRVTTITTTIGVVATAGCAFH